MSSRESTFYWEGEKISNMKHISRLQEAKQEREEDNNNEKNYNKNIIKSEEYDEMKIDGFVAKKKEKIKWFRWQRWRLKSQKISRRMNKTDIMIRSHRDHSIKAEKSREKNGNGMGEEIDNFFLFYWTGRANNVVV